MQVGHKIKKLRELKNLTQEHMSEQLEMTQSNYSKIEKNEVTLSLSRLGKIAEILGLNIEDILSFNEQMVFNVMNNKVGTGLIIKNQISPEMKKLYEEQIEILKTENAYLKKLLEQQLLK